MKVLVTGATGFVGGHLIKRLTARGDEVVCLVRTTSHIQNIIDVKARVRYYLDDMDYDIVYHLAGALGKKGRPMKEYLAPAIEMTKAIMYKMKPGQKFLFMSSQNILLEHLKPYETVKIAAEEVVTRVAEERGIDYRIVRPGFIYGPGDYHHKPLFDKIKDYGSLFPIIGDGKNMVCPTFIGDVIDMTELAFDIEERIIPIAGRPVQMRVFLGIIADALGVGAPRIHIPAIKIPPLREALKVDFFTLEQPYTSIIEPTPLEIGIRDSMSWYRKGE